MAQWLICCASKAGAFSSIPGWETKIPTCHEVWPKKKKSGSQRSSSVILPPRGYLAKSGDILDCHSWNSGSVSE